MTGCIITLLFLLSLYFSAISGQSVPTGAAALAGAEAGLRFCFSIAGGLCFWCALMELMERCGLAARLSAALQPLLRRLFPHACTQAETLAALSENLSANLLGLGNAATPAGIRAARGIARLGEPAFNELGTLVVLNTASVQLLPGTIIALRAAAGASAPFDVMGAVWISSLLSVAAGLGAAAILKRLWR